MAVSTSARNPINVKSREEAKKADVPGRSAEGCAGDGSGPDFPPGASIGRTARWRVDGRLRTESRVVLFTVIELSLRL